MKDDATITSNIDNEKLKFRVKLESERRTGGGGRREWKPCPCGQAIQDRKRRGVIGC